MQSTFACAAALSLAASVVSMGCADVGRGLGEPCIHNLDCLSGLCAELQCVAPTASPDATPSSTDASSDATDGGQRDAVGDTSADVASDVRTSRG